MLRRCVPCFTKLQRGPRRSVSVESQQLRALLPVAGDIRSASNELRWLREHADQSSLICNTPDHDGASRLQGYVDRRARGEPLQYILGNQPFGDLEILCERNALIPRPETETWTTNLAVDLVRGLNDFNYVAGNRPLRILDLGTGTGCIALLLHNLLRPPKLKGPNTAENSERDTQLQIVGVDVSGDALDLAHRNLSHNIQLGNLTAEARNEVHFHKADILRFGRFDRTMCQDVFSSMFENGNMDGPPSIDVVVSNPPYISEADYQPGGRTEASVRDFEPKLALVPDESASRLDHDHIEDRFYYHVLTIASHLRSAVIFMEVGDSDQAARVRHLVHPLLQVKHDQNLVMEVHRDDGSSVDGASKDSGEHGPGPSERAVAVWLDHWATLRSMDK